MTEKRFTLAYEKGNWWAVRDGEITLWKEEVVGLLNQLNDENEKLKKELFESEKDYLIETYSDNPARRDEKIQGLKEEFKERFGGS